LTDDFADVVPGVNWNWSPEPLPIIKEQNNEAIVSFPNNANALYKALQSKRYYDLTGGAISVKVTKASTTPMNRTFFLLKFDDYKYIQIQKLDTSLECVVSLDSNNAMKLKTLPYDAVNHAYWRLRHDGTNIHWETSPDGSTWTSHASFAASTLGFAIDALRVDLGMQATGTMTTMDEAHFAKVNGGGAPVGQWCPANQLSDTFDMKGRAWDRSYSPGNGCTFMANGQLQFALKVGVKDYCAFVSSTAYELKQGAVVIEAPAITNNAASAEVFFRLEAESEGRHLEIAKTGAAMGTGTLELRLTNPTTTLKSLSYDPMNHRWWRLRQEGTSIYWDVSKDGTSGSWVVAYFAPLPFPLNMVDVVIGVGAFGPAEGAVSASFDNYNQ